MPTGVSAPCRACASARHDRREYSCERENHESSYASAYSADRSSSQFLACCAGFADNSSRMQYTASTPTTRPDSAPDTESPLTRAAKYTSFPANASIEGGHSRAPINRDTSSRLNPCAARGVCAKLHSHATGVHTLLGILWKK